MLKSLVVTLALASTAVTGFAGLAQANRWDCAMTVTKGGCPVLIYQPDQQPPKPQGN
jgi:hypothetical protein